MTAIRDQGFDAEGNFSVSPMWMPEGVKTGISVAEIATMEDSGQPLSSLIFHIQTFLPMVESPTIKDPTKAANAKAQTLQTRLDGLMDAEGKFHAGELLISCDKATQVISVSAVPLSSALRPPLDADFDTTFAEVSIAQNAYFKEHGSYAQVLPGGVKPDYQSDSLLPGLGSQYEVQQFSGPRGAGWILLAHTQVNGTGYTKARQFGAEAYELPEWEQQ